MIRLLEFIGVLLISAAAEAVAAPEETTPSVPSPQKVYVLRDTIRVVGERLAIDPLHIPAAATLITASEWDTKRVAGIDEALQASPGVVAQSRGGGQDVRVTIRGFGARGSGDRSNAGTTRGIRVSLDGFPLTEPDGRTSLDLADLDLMNAVRVIRSNTSGLYGPASGGLIDLYSTNRFPTPFAEGHADFGSFGYRRQSVDVGLMAGSARIHLSGSTSSFEGWRQHSGGSQTTLMASILSDLSSRTGLSVFVYGTRNLQRQPGALTQAEFDADPRQADPTYLAQNARRDNLIGRVAVKLAQRIGESQSLRIGGFVEPKTIHRSERNRYRDFQRVHTGVSLLYTVPFSVKGKTLRAMFGADDAYQDGSVLFYDLGPGGTRGRNQVADQREGINIFGGFMEVEFAPATRWTITAGARWDFIHYISEDHQAPAYDATMTLKRASPRATVAMRVAPDHSIHAALSSGIEAPAFNEIDPPAPFDTLTTLNPFLVPATSTTFEIGAKGTARFGRCFDTFTYDVALYTLEVDHEIIPWDNGTFYRTAGKSRRSGVEIGLSAQTDYGLTARVAITATRNRYVDYTTGAPNDLGNLVVVSYDDNESAGIPSAVFNGSLRYQHAAGVFVEGGFHHIGKYFANDANTDRVPAYDLYDLTAGVTLRIAGSTDVEIFVSGRNLSDEKFVASAYVNGVNGRYLEPGMERNFYVGVKLRRLD